MQAVEIFQVQLQPEQSAILERWLEASRIIWNEGRSLLLFQQAMTAPYRIKVAKPDKDGVLKETLKTALAPSCSLNRKWFKNEDGFAEHSWIIDRDCNGGTVDMRTGKPTHRLAPDLIRVGQCCPLPGRDYLEPRLGLEPFGKYTLQYWFSHKHIKEIYPMELAQLLCEIPAWFIRGVCEDLSLSWGLFLKGDRGAPRFKSADNLTESLRYGDAQKLSVGVVEDAETMNQKAAKKDDPRIFEVGDGLIQVPKLGKLLVKRFAKDWGAASPQKVRPILVLQLVKNEGAWKLHLTGWEPQPTDVYHPFYLELHECLLHDLSPQFKLAWLLYLREFSFWAQRRTAVTKLTVPGEGYTVAVDDRGKSYTVLPVRCGDGAIDPHRLIQQMDEQIIYLQRAIAVQEERLKLDKQAGVTSNQGHRLEANKQKLRRVSQRRALILKNNRKKLAQFICERSASVEVTVKQSEQTRKKKPKAKLTAGSFDPATYDPNGAERVAAANKEMAGSAPGEFVALIKQEARERAQRVLMIVPPKEKQKKRRKSN